MLRTSLRPGLLKAVAYNAIAPQHGGAPVRDGPRLPARPGRGRRRARPARSSPTSGSTSVWSWPVPTPPPRCGPGWPWPSASAWIRRMWPTRSIPASTPPAAGRPGWPARWSARWARSTPTCSTPTASTSGWPGSSSTSGALLHRAATAAAYRPVIRFPSSDVDLAFAVPAATSAVAVERTLAGASPLVWSVRLFDAYRGAGVADDERSLAFRLRFQAPDRTLTDAEVAEARQPSSTPSPPPTPPPSAPDPTANCHHEGGQGALMVAVSGVGCIVMQPGARMPA